MKNDADRPSSEEAQTRAAPKRLTHIQSHKVCTWIESKKEFLEKTTESYDNLAKVCAQHTKTPITTLTFREMVKDLGIVKGSKAPKEAPKPKGGKVWRRIGEQAKQIEDLTQQVVYLRRQLEGKLESVLVHLELEIVQTADSGKYVCRDTKR
jgi:hypothetical protein